MINGFLQIFINVSFIENFFPSSLMNIVREIIANILKIGIDKAAITDPIPLASATSPPVAKSSIKPMPIIA